MVVGPFVHAMPDYVDYHPGPGFDGRGDMIRWFNYWLKGDNTSYIIDEPDLTFFIRTSLTTGFYRYEPEWPIPRQQRRRMFLSRGQKLLEEENDNNDDVDVLVYRPEIGLEAGIWWGYALDDQRPFDQHCLIYESERIQKSTEIVGFVNISLQVEIFKESN